MPRIVVPSNNPLWSSPVWLGKTLASVPVLRRKGAQGTQQKLRTITGIIRYASLKTEIFYASYDFPLLLKPDFGAVKALGVRGDVGVDDGLAGSGNVGVVLKANPAVG